MSSPLPVARALIIAPWVETVQRLGAPAEALLVRAGIRPELLQHPNALFPLQKGLRWVELACQSLGTQQLGLHVADATANEDLGPYGSVLSRAHTLYQYLHQGVSLYGSVVLGQRFRLSTQGAQVRLHLDSPWQPTLGDYQSQLNSFAITIANIRRFAGPRWAPEEISFGFRPGEAPPSAEIFDGTRVAYRPGETYLQFPRALLGQGLCDAVQGSVAAQSVVTPALPNDLAGLASLQIDSLLSGRAVTLELLAESLGMSGRSLQRCLANQGASFTALLGDLRLRRAAEWLQRTDKPVVEIALDLGYTDASNFTRAFRRAIGVSPSVFRKAAERR
jgi:AraC-like DNA-binding protein